MHHMCAQRIHFPLQYLLWSRLRGAYHLALVVAPCRCPAFLQPFACCACTVSATTSTRTSLAACSRRASPTGMPLQRRKLSRRATVVRDVEESLVEDSLSSRHSSASEPSCRCLLVQLRSRRISYSRHYSIGSRGLSGRGKTFTSSAQTKALQFFARRSRICCVR